MVNNMIVFNSLNPDEELNAKEYQHIIAKGLIAKFSSRARSESEGPIKMKRGQIRSIVTDHISCMGKKYGDVSIAWGHQTKI